MTTTKTTPSEPTGTQPIDDYKNVTPLEWAEYEFATTEYDYKIHPDAAKTIRSIFRRLYGESRTQDQMG